LLAAAKSAAAATAIVAAVLLWRRMPDLLALPSREQFASSQAALQHANQELESFMSSVSHDLRSPLTTIAGQAGLLELSLGANANDDVKRRVHRIHHSVRHMSELIEALLTLSRISRQELRPEALDISALARTTFEELRRQDPQREVSITIQPDLRARGDRRLVTALLAHVLGNAWKFTSHTQSARIEVGESKDSAGTTLFVRDNGAGFDMAYESKLFKPFQRLHSPAEFDGAGIGLASAARIIERHGGKIWAQAQPNTGAVFFFTLPKAEPSHQPASH
jgi:light-regulated signal transduction histidine kinase (bacteriophytochrome)